MYHYAYRKARSDPTPTAILMSHLSPTTSLKRKYSNLPQLSVSNKVKSIPGPLHEGGPHQVGGHVLKTLLTNKADTNVLNVGKYSLTEMNYVIIKIHDSKEEVGAIPCSECNDC